nr:hypothetical protein [Tanacetum cinerariifolium]
MISEVSRMLSMSFKRSTVVNGDEEWSTVVKLARNLLILPEVSKTHYITNKLAGCKATGAPNCIGLAATKLQWCQQYQRCSGMEIAPAQQKCRTCCNVNNKMQPILIIKLAVQYVAIDVVGLLMSTLQVE